MYRLASRVAGTWGVLGVTGMAAGWAGRHAGAPAVQRWAAGTGRRRRAGRLQVRMFGTGDPVIVLLHGMVASSNYFGTGFDRLGKRGTVVIPDLLGFGDSPAAPGPLTADDHLTALHEMLEVLDFSERPIIAAGHSMGSILALRWAAELTEQVRAVVGICSPLYRTAAEADNRLRRMGRLEAFLAGDGPLPRMMCDWMCRHRTAASWLTVALRPDLPVPVARAAVKHTWDTYRGSLIDVVRNRQWEPALLRLGATGVPVTLVEAARDPVPVPGRAAELVATLPAAEHRVHPDATHHLPMTDAPWCAAQIANQSGDAGVAPRPH